MHVQMKAQAGDLHVISYEYFFWQAYVSTILPD